MAENTKLITTETPTQLLDRAIQHIGGTDAQRGWCIVTPRSFLKRDVEKALLEGHEGKAWLGTRAMTLPELIEHYARRLEGQPTLTWLQVRQIIASLVRDIHEENPDSFPGQVTDRRVSEATLRSLTRLFAELEPFNLTAEQLEDKLFEGPISEEIAQRTRDVVAVYKRYMKAVEESEYRGPQEESVRATEMAAQMSPPSGTKRFLFLGFDGAGLASPGYSFFEALGENPEVEESVMLLVMPEDVTESAWSSHGNLPFFREWTEAGRPRTSLTGKLGELDRPQDLEALATDPFAYRHQPAQSTGAVEAFRVPDSQLEIEWVARDIKEKILEGRFQPEDVAVIARDMEHRGREFQQELERLGLPVVASHKEYISAVPAVRALISVFRVLADGWKLSDVVSVAESPYLPLGLNPTLLSRVGSRGTTPEGPEDWLQRIEKFATAAAQKQHETEQAAAREAQQLSENFARMVRQLRELIGSAEMTSQGWAQALTALVEAWGLEEQIHQSSDLVSRQERAGLARMDIDGVNALLEAANDWLRGRELAGTADQQLDAQGWLEELEAMTRQTSIRRSSYPRRAIQLLTPEQAALRNFKKVYVVGLVDGVFPRRRDPEENVLSEEERRILQLRTQEGRAAHERLLFHLSAAAATEGLTLVAPASDDRGKALVTSPFISCMPLRIDGFKIQEVAARELVPESETDILSGRDVDLLAADRYRELTEIAEGDIAGLKESIEDDPLVAYWLSSETSERALRAWRVERTRADLEHFLRLYPEGARRPPRSEFVGMLDEEHIPEHIKEDDFTISPSELETYGTCHFKFMASRIWGLWAGPDQAEDHNEAAAFGSLQHKILEALYRQMASEGRLPPEGPEDVRRGLEMLDEVAQHHVQKHMASAHRRLWSLDLDFVLDVLKNFVRRDLSGMLEAHTDSQSTRLRTRIVSLEQFMGEAAGRPLEFDVLDEKFQLHGKLDRIEKIQDPRLPDAAQDWLVIRDYKSSRNTYSLRSRHDDYLTGDKLQLPLYAAMAEHFYDGRVFAFGELLTSLSDDPGLFAVRELLPSPEGVELVRPQNLPQKNPVASAKRAALQESARRVKKMRKGQFTTQPDRQCWGCHLKDVCRASKLDNPARMRQRAHMPLGVDSEQIKEARKEARKQQDES